MSELRFDPSASTIKIETRAKGMLAKLAHDLSIDVRDPEVSLAHDGDKVTLKLGALVAKLSVDGVRKGDSVDHGVLSASDRSEIERKIQREVFSAARVDVVLDAPVSPDALAPGAASSSVEASGRLETGRASTRVSTRVRLEPEAGRVVASARAKLSLPALGITPPKGPLGAFRVDDDVEVVVKLAFARG